jgi:hypothetical protein
LDAPRTQRPTATATANSQPRPRTAKSAKKNTQKGRTFTIAPKQKQLLTSFVFFFHWLFYRVNEKFGRFVASGVQKHEKKEIKKVHLGSSKTIWLFFLRFFSPTIFCSIFVLRFWAFVDKGGLNTR